MNRLNLLLLSLLCAGRLLYAGEIRLLSPRNGAVVSQLNAVQKEYLTLPRTERVARFANAEYRANLAKKGGYRPLPVTFSWESDLPQGSSCTVTVSETADFTRSITVTTHKTQAALNNFKIAQKYYWKVVSVQKDKTVVSPVFTFTTEDQAPRLLTVSYVANVRDLGGRKAMDGKRVKQGMAIRSGGLNENATYLRASSPEELCRHKPELRLPLAIADETLKNLKEAQKGSAGKTALPCALNSSWTVFFPAVIFSRETAAEISGLTKIPKMWKGAAGKNFSLPEGSVRFPGHKEGKTALLMQEFESAADGVMAIDAGADWYWMLWINGKLMYDAFAGNGADPSAKTHCLNLPVKKGKNLIALFLKSGSAGWSWHCADAKSKAVAENFERMLKAEKTHYDDLMRTPISKDRIVPGKCHLSQETKRMLVKEWGIRTDLDLRSDGECFGMKGSPLGDEVRWVQVSSAMYAGLGEEKGKEAFREVFKVFLDKANYPLIFHCIGGQDRTGAVAFILNGLLGVEEEELYKDWESSGFMNRNLYFRHEKCFNKLLKVFDKYPGKTIHEKIENYVISLGFTRADIEKFRSIMLE